MVRKLDWEHPKRESEGWIGKWKSFQETGAAEEDLGWYPECVDSEM